MRVLVTGGAGMIGFHLAKYYREQGHSVTVLDNLERSSLLGYNVTTRRMTYNITELSKMGVFWARNDVSKQESWDELDDENFDLILHMAAQTSVPTSIVDPRRDFEVNTIGTFNMLEYARKHGSKVVYASTNKVYPLHSNWTFNKGSSRWEWNLPHLRAEGWKLKAMDMEGSRTPYGNSKFAGDQLCQEWWHMYEIPTGIFRMSCIYGTNQFSFEEQGWLTWFAIATLRGDPINIYGDGCQVRDCLWVEDVVKAYDSYVKSDTPHGVWNLGGGPYFTLSLNECLDTLEDITGKRSPVTYHDWRPSDQRVYTSCIGPLKKDLGWEPTVSPKEGLEKVVEWVEPILDIF